MLDEYLDLLGLTRQAPSADYLRALHRAHVSKVAYSNLDIRLGNPGGLDPAESVARVLAGRGGYCFQLNGALAWLLRELGFAVTLHRGFVYKHGDPSEPRLNHMVLVVHDLAEAAWFVDAGLGDGIYDPLPLVPGVYPQRPFSYRLGAATGRDGWRFTHDVFGSFEAMEFESAAVALEDFAEAHVFQSTSPESSFTKFLTAQVRLPGRVAALRCLSLTTIDESGKRAVALGTFAQWRECLTGLGIAAGAADALWDSEQAVQAQWLAMA